ncbi:hypothetical protein RFI_02724 [Reticulomyxa filosa]|uniref:Roadblock/LAMTOR2 domain-containing protein n=1 Tax=Reticulomyxa filosa TaxID=46433 RepID=X6P887_RETFI|nr:hypothetical protein RFI_02724 [Reticulomyxa filosa]|eukprot:ETO34371.1 hypothetical protein RFI_02724 [Reticulomyxa filosa]
MTTAPSTSAMNISELLQELVYRVEDLQLLQITDNNGAVVAKGCIEELEGNTDDVETSRMSFALQQASKISLGECSSVISYFENCVLMHMKSFDNQLILTCVALKNVNMALMFEMEPKLKRVLDTVAKKINEFKTQKQQNAVTSTEETN